MPKQRASKNSEELLKQYQSGVGYKIKFQILNIQQSNIHPYFAPVLLILHRVTDNLEMTINLQRMPLD